MTVLDMLHSPWAILPKTLDEMEAIYWRKMGGGAIALEEFQAATGLAPVNRERNYELINGVAVLDLSGVVAKKMNLFSSISGGISTEWVSKVIHEAIDDQAVKSILLSFDSPGGSVIGLPELAQTIFEARNKKKIVALADGLMASAAYWIGSAASEVCVASETVPVGSIGVVAKHVDISKLEEKAGRKTTEIYAGRFKCISTEFEPLTSEGRADIQARVDYLYSVFVNTVSKHRNQSVEKVLSDMADGRIFMGSQAVDAGLVDAVKTKEELLDELSSTNSNKTIYFSKSEVATVSGDNNQSETEMFEATVETLKRDHPELVVEIQKNAATAERERIQGVLAQSMPGSEEMIQTLAFDGVTQPGEAAVKVLENQREKAAKVKQDIAADAPDPADIDASASDAESSEETQADSKDVAKRAQELMDEAEAKGVTLSAREAVKRAKAEFN